MNTPEYALSIKQPWADRIFFEGKDIENRTWRLPDKLKGARIFVHAGKKPDLDAFEPESQYPTNRFGAILGEVTIVDCVTESESEWFLGPYGFVLADPKSWAKPLPCRGQLGFFKVEGRLVSPCGTRPSLNKAKPR